MLVYFDPEVYVYTEGDVAILTLKTDTEVQKRFSVIVTANDGSAESMFKQFVSFHLYPVNTFLLNIYIHIAMKCIYCTYFYIYIHTYVN